MTKLKTKLSTFLLLIFISGKLFGQLNIDAGNDRFICVGLWGMDPTMIGGNPTAAGGVEPYVYAWETNYTIGSNSYGASFFLDDSTKANPSIVNEAPDRLKFILTVYDNTGTKIRDSINVRFSSYAYTMAEYSATINQGETVALMHNIGNGIEPLSFSWTPNYNISDASISNPTAWPDVDTDYTVIATDSIGCVSEPDVFEVYVIPLGIVRSKKTNVKATVFPNPIDDKSKIYLDENKFTNLEIQVINTNGELVLSDIMNSDSYDIGTKLNRTGLYVFFIMDNKEVISSGQFVKKY